MLTHTHLDMRFSSLLKLTTKIEMSHFMHGIERTSGMFFKIKYQIIRSNEAIIDKRITDISNMYMWCGPL